MKKPRPLTHQEQQKLWWSLEKKYRSYMIQTALYCIRLKGWVGRDDEIDDSPLFAERYVDIVNRVTDAALAAIENDEKVFYAVIRTLKIIRFKHLKESRNNNFTFNLTNPKELT